MFSTKTEFDSYLAEIAGIEVPDICESVLFKWYGQEPIPHRVTGWYRAIPDIKPDFKDIGEELCWEVGEESRANRRKKQEVLTKACRREEATHVGIYAVAGAVVRIDRIQRTGKYVKWSEERIEQLRDSWIASLSTLRFLNPTSAR